MSRWEVSQSIFNLLLPTTSADLDCFFSPTTFHHLLTFKYAQVGLSLAHLAAWDTIISQDLPGAWIFEDDVVAHEDFATLFPRYWATVPADYEVIWLGHLPIYGSVACENAFTNRLLHEDFVWCTHAMIISKAGAERLASAMRGILEMSSIAERIPHKYELNIDLFLNYVGEFFLPHSERHNWVIFDAAGTSMSSWGGHKWCTSTDFAMEEFNYNGTCCETCDMDAVRAVTSVGVPLMGTGLVYQNLCKIDPWRLEDWKKGKQK